MPYDDLDEVAAWANDTPYGLGASIWSNNLSKVHRLIPKIQSGTVWVNCHSTDRKSTRLNSSHLVISYAVFCLKKKKNQILTHDIKKTSYQHTITPTCT